jgi:phosphoglycolate phosphatase
LQVAADRLTVMREGAAWVGDSANDMRAAKAAGMRALAVSYGYNHGVDLQSLGATVITEDFGKLPDLVRFDEQFLLSKVMP